MSNIYIQEPPCSGKVLLQTTVGDIDIELWSKETPRACRNFIQLCMEGYYDGTIFHRVIKDFIAQGGDPNGDGTGGESIYGAPFKDEFHSRLRFLRRGLVAMANSEKDDNGSQFFFTLGPCPELQNKHTIFGKVTGDTVFNMLKLGDCYVGQNDKPLYPHNIITAKVLFNPFDDIIPRNKKFEQKSSSAREKEKIKKNLKLLSFGEEAEEEELEANSLVQKYRGKSKSSHDLANDPKLSSVSVMSLYDENEQDISHNIENIRRKLNKPGTSDVKQMNEHSSVLEEGQRYSKNDAEANESKMNLIKKEIKELKRHLKARKVTEEKATSNFNTDNNNVEAVDHGNRMLQDFHSQSHSYRNKHKDICSDSGRNEKTLEILSQFTKKIEGNRSIENDDSEENSVGSEESSIDSEGNSPDSKSRWLAHEMHCQVAIPVAKDANLPAADRYGITDPRNPINKRRRLERKKKS